MNAMVFSLFLSLFLSLSLLFRSPSLRKAFTHPTLDYQRASLQQKLLVTVSCIKLRSIDRWRGSGWNIVYCERQAIPIISTTVNGQRRLGIPNRQLRDGNVATWRRLMIDPRAVAFYALDTYKKSLSFLFPHTLTRNLAPQSHHGRCASCVSFFISRRLDAWNIEG